MTKFVIQDWHTHYENYKVKANNKWYFLSPELFYKLIIGKTIKGKIVKKRTRVWIE